MVVDREEGLRELAQLWTAPNAEALHRVLLMHAPIRGRSADTFEPFALLSQHHKAEPATSVVTATLLLTDRRWCYGVGQLIRRIADSDILGDDDLDLLARTFLTAGDAVYWQLPDEWFDDSFEIIIGEADDVDDADDDMVETTPPPPAVTRRKVLPPLRRWAAARTLTRAPESWPAVRARADELDARSGAAVMCGLLEAVDVLPPAAQATLIDEGLTWSDHAVRQLALTLLSKRKGAAAACRIAQHDRNARIRAWGAKLLESASSDDAPGSQSRLAAKSEPPSLF